MTASTDTGVEEFNSETSGPDSKSAATVPPPTPEEPDQPGTPKKTGTFEPHDSGIPQSHILEDEG